MTDGDSGRQRSRAPRIGLWLSSVSFRARSSAYRHRKSLSLTCSYLLDAIAELSEARKRGVRLDFGRRGASVNGERVVTESHSSSAGEGQHADASHEGTQEAPHEAQAREAHQARRSLYYSSEESDTEQGGEHAAKPGPKDAHPEARSSDADLDNAQVKTEKDTSNHSAPSPPSPSSSQKRPRPAAEASEQGSASIENDLLDAFNTSSPKRQRTE